MKNQGAGPIIRRILEGAGAQVETILAEAREDAARTVAAAEKTAMERREEALRRAELQAEEQRRCILGASDLETRKKLLQTKQDMIEGAFKQALHDLSHMDRESYFKLLGKMILAAAEQGDEVVIMSPRDRKEIPAGFWEELNRRLVEDGRKGQLVPAEESRDLAGGVVLQAGGVEINSSFGALLEMYREELEPAVAALLFDDR
ncbi:MAG: hypothetical protein GX973_06465 [Firmicutes bacterium]|nr:hypothetical protein [Bacillota bacterium]